MEQDRHPSLLRKRIRRHETLVLHMTTTYITHLQLWCRSPYHDEVVSRPGRRSLETPESREEYVRKAITYERHVMKFGDTPSG